MQTFLLGDFNSDALARSKATLTDSLGAYVMTVNDSTPLDGFLLDQVYILKTVSEEHIVTFTVHSI